MNAIGYEDERPPEVSCYPTPSPCPPWDAIPRTVTDIHDLVGHLSYHVASAIAGAWRAGIPPGHDAAADLREAADHLLREALRLERRRTYARDR